MLVQVNQSEVFHIDDIEHPVGAGSSSFVGRKEHVVLVGDDVIEERVVVAVVLLFVVPVGCLEELEDFYLAGNFYHLYNFR